MESSHQAVARPRAVSAANVNARADANNGGTGDRERTSEQWLCGDLCCWWDAGVGEEGNLHVHHPADHHDIAEGAESRSLAERDPEEQHEDAAQLRGGADLNAELLAEALMQNLPRREPNPCGEHHHEARGEDRLTGDGLRESLQRIGGDRLREPVAARRAHAVPLTAAWLPRDEGGPQLPNRGRPQDRGRR